MLGWRVDVNRHAVTVFRAFRHSPNNGSDTISDLILVLGEEMRVENEGPAHSNTSRGGELDPIFVPRGKMTCC